MIARVPFRPIAAAAVVLALSMPAAVRADDGAQDRIVARLVFEEGLRLMGERRYAEACAQFEDSERLDPKIDTLLGLAGCQAQMSKTASAWASYLEAASLAKATGQPGRERTARARAAALEPRLSKLTIVVGAGAASLEIKLDGKVVPPSLWGTPVPVDPGDHTVTAGAPGKIPWSATITVKPDGGGASLPVPQLDAEPSPPPAPPPPPPSPPAAAPFPADVTPPPPPPDTGRTSRLVLGINLGIVGLGAMGIGTAYVVQAGSKDDQSNAYCGLMPPLTCSAEGVSLRNTAHTDRIAGAVALVAGGAATVAGVVLVITSAAPSAPARAGSLSFTVGMAPSGGGAVGLKGSF